MLFYIETSCTKCDVLAMPKAAVPKHHEHDAATSGRELASPLPQSLPQMLCNVLRTIQRKAQMRATAKWLDVEVLGLSYPGASAAVLFWGTPENMARQAEADNTGVK